MIAVDDAYQAISNKVPGVDRYHKKRITREIDDTRTDLLMTPVIGSHTEYGSDTPAIEIQEIEIQVFIRTESKTTDLDTIKNLTVSFLAPKWQASYGPDEGTDLETDEITLTSHLTRNFIMRGN